MGPSAWDSRFPSGYNHAAPKSLTHPMLHGCGIDDARAGMLSPERSDVQEAAVTQDKASPRDSRC
jgi:hypothetical protein